MLTDLKLLLSPALASPFPRWWSLAFSHAIGTSLHVLN